MIEYKEHPGSAFESYRAFNIIVAAGDYHLCISDSRQEIIFRFCINGGFEHSHPKTMTAIAELYRAMQEEATKE